MENNNNHNNVKRMKVQKEVLSINLLQLNNGS